jgi:hypothetical protein
VNFAASGRSNAFTTQDLRRIPCLSVFGARAFRGSQ